MLKFGSGMAPDLRDRIALSAALLLRGLRFLMASIRSLWLRTIAAFNRANSDMRCRHALLKITLLLGQERSKIFVQMSITKPREPARQ